MATIKQLTSAFESLASMRLSQIKNQVLQAKNFSTNFGKYIASLE